MALIARHGAEWFRALGSASQPGTALVTLGGAVADPGVYEIALGQPAGRRRRAAPAALTERRAALLVGGYGGDLARRAAHRTASRSSDGDPRLGAGSIGAGVLWVLGAGTPAASAESARVLGWLAAESAGQCGPCLFGLRAIADSLRAAGATAPRAPGADAPAALGRRRHRPRRLPPPRRRRAASSRARCRSSRARSTATAPGGCTAAHAPSMPLPDRRDREAA